MSRAGLGGGMTETAVRTALVGKVPIATAASVAQAISRTLAALQLEAYVASARGPQ